MSIEKTALKWVREGQGVKTQRGNLVAQIHSVKSSTWELTIHREWCNAVTIETERRGLAEAIFSTQAKAKEGASALISLMGAKS